MTGDKAAAAQAELAELRLRLEEAEQTLHAIRYGEVDSILVDGVDGLRVYALEGTGNSHRVLVECMNEGAATLTAEGVVLYCNSRLARMLDVPLQRVMGSALRERVPEQWQQAFDALLQFTEQGRGEGRSEIPLLGGNGEEIPAYLSLSAMEDQGRRILCMVATDLREQRRNEELVRAEALARSVLDQAAEAIVVCDGHGRITRASKAATQLAGGDPLSSTFDAAFPVRLTGRRAGPEGSPVAAALDGDHLHACRGTLQTADGRQVQLLVSAAPLRGTDQQPLGCVITMTDVTHVYRADERLRDSEERLRLALAGGMQGTWDWFPRTGELAWDARCRGLFGLAADAPVAFERFLSIVHPDDRERVLGEATAAERARSSYQQEYRIVLPDGATRWLLARGRVFGGSDQSVRMVGTVADISERKLHEESLRQADEHKNQFLAVLSHELRNPLTPITNSMYILQRAEPGGEQAKRAQETIHRQVAHLRRLVDDLLDNTRIARNRIELRREVLDLNELVRSTAEDYRPHFENGGVHLDVRLFAQPVWVWGDGARLLQVVGNLLQNAAKFTPRGGHANVAVTVDPHARRVALRVTDTGDGLAANVLAHLFEPFAQADQGLDRSRGGLGLGLALAKTIVEMHGGEMGAYSAGPGDGAEFSVFLPLTDPAGEPPAAPVEAGPARRRRILIVEDNVDAAESLKMLLELDRHEVEIANDGPAGVRMARQWQPDVVLCDLGLPGMDGYAVARALRSEAGLRDALLVALSGYARPEDVRRATEAGFDSHLAKPPDLAQLMAVLSGGVAQARPA